MTPTATLKATPTPELISKILARAAAGADAVVIHLPLYANIHFDDGAHYFILKSILKPYETSCKNRSKSTQNRRSFEKVRGVGAAASHCA